MDDRVKAVVLLGEAAHDIADALAGRFNTVFVSGMTNAVHSAASLADAGDTVLLSPACAARTSTVPLVVKVRLLPSKPSGTVAVPPF